MSQQKKYRVICGPIQARFATPIVQLGGTRIGGSHFYEGAILPEIEPEQLRHLLDLGMVEEVPDPTPAEPGATD